MLAISQSDAEKLYNILDNLIGVFKEPNMSEKAQRFYHEKHDEFIGLMTSDIPELFWFQGFGCTSVNLTFSSVKGFHVSSDIDNRNIGIFLETVNKKLSELKLNFIEVNFAGNPA